MNYYEHHIGDYAEATAHLTFVEDAAYSRMIRKYYATEKPLPVDVGAVQRLVGARTQEERDAVAAILQEFFRLETDGWHNARCDEEVTEYLDGEPERIARKVNQAERLKRHREERARLFEDLRTVNHVPAYKTSMEDLRALHARYCSRLKRSIETTETGTKRVSPPETELKRVATALETRNETRNETPATATQSPVPSPQSPVSISEGGNDLKQKGNALQPLHQDAGNAGEPQKDDSTDHQVWLELRADYPAGTYEKSAFFIGEKVARQRIDDGFTWNDLRAGVKRMTAQATAKGNVGTQYIWSPAKFFGRDPDAPHMFVFQRDFVLPRAQDKAATETAERKARDKAELQKLMDGRAGRGLQNFRDPWPFESADMYASYLRQEEIKLFGHGATNAVSAAASILANAKKVMP